MAQEAAGRATAEPAAVDRAAASWVAVVRASGGMEMATAVGILVGVAVLEVAAEGMVVVAAKTTRLGARGSSSRRRRRRRSRRGLRERRRPRARR